MDLKVLSIVKAVSTIADKIKIASYCNVLLVLLTFFFLTSSQAFAQGWSARVVDNYRGAWNDIKLDGNGKPHIAYAGQSYLNLYYASMEGTSWAIQQITASDYAAQYISLAIDSMNRPHISYYSYDGTKYILTYVSWEGTQWVSSTVESSTNVGDGTHGSLALDSNDQPHISFYSQTNGDLKYASWEGTSWVISTVDSTDNVGEYTSLALDGNNIAHISYSDSTNTAQNLKYASWEGTGWAVTSVDTPGVVAQHTSIALDSTGKPYISYYDATNGYLKYATLEAAGWGVQTVDTAGNVGWYSDISLGTDNMPHIGYMSLSSELKYASLEATGWNVQTIEGISINQLSSDLDQNNMPVFAVYGGDDTLKYVTYDSAPPQVTLEAPQGSGITLNEGQNYIISWEATDDNGFPVNNYISIYFSTNEGSSWTLLTDTESNDPGTNTGTYEWQVPSIFSNNCLISVEARDNSGQKDNDISGNLFTILQLPAIAYVSPTGSDSSGDGTYGNPYRTVQKGLNSVTTGGEVRLEPGVYNETGDYNILWPDRQAITLKLSPEATSPATIDAQGLDRVINTVVAVSMSIESVTINGGYIVDNGAGIFLQDGCDLRLTNVVIINCTAESSEGGAIWSESSNVIATNCIFIGNRAQYGGVTSAYNANWQAVNSVFAYNSADNDAGVVAWPGIWSDINCVYYNNSAPIAGVVEYIDTSWTSTNSIFWGNSSLDGNVFAYNNTDPVVSYSDLQPDGWDVPGGTININNSISSEPLFISTTYGDANFLKPLPTSETVDTGTFEGAPATAIDGTLRPSGEGYDMGVYEQAAPIAPRVWNATQGIGYLTIQAALSDTGLASGDVITTEAGIFNENNIVWPNVDNITLRGEISGLTTIDAQNLNRAFTVNYPLNITIESISIKNGTAPTDAHGGALYLAAGSNVSLRSVNVSDCTAPGANAWGGAILCASLPQKVYIDNSVFTNNSSFHGQMANGTWIVTNSIFKNNTSAFAGISWDGNWTVSNSIFYGNGGSTIGGISVGGTWNTTNCVFYGNSATSGSISSGTWTGKNDIYFSNGSAMFTGTTDIKYSNIQASGFIPDTGNISSEPLFISTTYGDPNFLKPLDTSETINSGTFEGAPAYAINGVSRPQPSTDPYANFDMGVYEQDRLLAEVYVSTFGDDSLGDGSDINPYKTIQKGLNSAATGANVNVFSGVYSGVGNHMIIWPGRNGITLKASSETSLVTLDATDVSFDLMWGISAEVSVQMSLESITMTNCSGVNVYGSIIFLQPGSRLDINKCNFINNVAYSGNGGIVFAGGYCYVKDSYFYNNSAANGGSNCVFLGGTFEANNCMFSNSSAGSGNFGVGSGDKVVLEGCTVKNSYSNWLGGALGATLGIINNCTFEANSASYNGGVFGGGTWNITNSRFLRNWSGSGGGVSYNANITATNCAFVANTNNSVASVFMLGTANLYNCSFSHNDAIGVGDVAYGTNINAVNTIFWGTDDPFDLCSGSLDYCIVQNADWGDFTTSNCLSSNPQFLNGVTNLLLAQGSPALNSGTSVGAPGVAIDGTVRPQGSGYDRGVYEQDLGIPLLNIVYVSISGSDTTGDGSIGNPFRTVQNGLNYCATNGLVIVDVGIYQESSLYWPGRDNITLRGDLSGSSTIDAELKGRVFNVVDPINISVESMSMKNAFYYGDSGGIFKLVSNSNLQLYNVKVVNSKVWEGGVGGVVYCTDLTNNVSIRDCYFETCYSLNNGGNGGSGGVGANGNWNIYNSTFKDWAAQWGGAFATTGTITVDSSIFIGGYAGYGGVFGGGVVNASNSIFRSNTAAYGGIIVDSIFTSKNCVFDDVISVYPPALALGGTWESVNSIYWNCRAAEFGPGNFSNTDVDVRYSNIAPDAGYFITGEGNISVEPKFISTTLGNSNYYRIGMGSLCIDTATNESGVPLFDAASNERPRGFGADMGAYEFMGTSIRIISPNGGELLTTEAYYDITYEISPDATEMKVRISTDGGLNWNTVISNEVWSHAAGVATLEWKPKSPLISANCLISVEVLSNGLWNADASDQVFEIISEPLIPIVYISPSGNDDTGDGSVLNPFKTLQRGLGKVEASGEVRAMPGVYTQEASEYSSFAGPNMTIWPNKTDISLRLTFEANGTTGLATVDAQGLGRIFVFSNGSDGISLTIEGISFVNGHGMSAPAGFLFIYASSGPILNVTARLNNIHTSNCTADTIGGAVYSDNSSKIYCEDSTFTGGSSGSAPAGFSAYASWNIKNSSIINMTGGSIGGAIYGGTWEVENCYFANNSCNGHGGVFGWVDCYIKNSTFESNSANTNNGGVFSSTTGTITNCSFINNTASIYGGVFTYGSGMSVYNSTFIGNMAVVGGGILAQSGPYYFYECVFKDNHTDNDASIFSQSSTTAKNCLFVNNYSKRYMFTQSTFNFNNCTLYGNTAESYVIADNCAFDAKNSIVYGNSSDDGTIFGTSMTWALTYSDIQPDGYISGLTGNISVEPLFISTNYGDPDFLKPLVTSETVDTGTFEGAPAFDITGLVARPQSSLYPYMNFDMGVYEQAGPSKVWNATQGLGFKTIQSALSYTGLAPGDVITTEAIIFNEYNIVWPNVENITLRGSVTGPTTIDAQGLGRGIDVASAVNLTIEGVTIMHGLISGNGGGINLASGSVLTFKDSTLALCTTEGGGEAGGIYSDGSTVIAENSIFKNNMVVGVLGTWFASKCTFSENGIGGNGRCGAFYQVTITATNCVFSKNYSDWEAAILYNGTMYSYNNTYYSNSADEGAISAVSDWTDVNSIYWSNSTIPSGGNRLFFNMNSSSVTYSTIQLNNIDITGIGNIYRDPKFASIDGTATDYLYLGPNSASNDNASNVGAPADDKIGNYRPHGFGYDMGAYEFQGPSVSLEAPLGGESFDIGTPITITWRVSDETGLVPDSVNIRYSSDGGVTWNLIDTVAPADTGTYVWDPGSMSGSNFMISVEAINTAGLVGMDNSYSTFSLTSLQVYISPTGSDELGTGTIPNPFRTIQKGLNSVAPEGTVYMMQGVFTPESVTDIGYGPSMARWPNTNNITLVASPGATEPVTIDALSTCRIFEIPYTLNLTIEGIDVQNAYASSFNGGFIRANSGSTIINLISVEVRACTADSGGYGGAIYGVSDLIINMDNCLFEGCSATYGGVFFDGNRNARNSRFINNSGLYSSGVAYLGIFNAVNCIFAANTSPSGGGAVFESVTSNLINCTFFNNYAGGGDGGVFLYGIMGGVNNIFWGNISAGNGPVFWYTDATPTYSDIQIDGFIAGIGNLSSDPNFMVTLDAYSPNFLKPDAGSLCIDAGTPEGIVSPEISGNPRVQGFNVDMGAYEFTGPAVRVIYPNGGESLNVGDPVTITWETMGTIQDNVNIRYSNDGGASWNLIAGPIVNSLIYSSWDTSVLTPGMYLISVEVEDTNNVRVFRASDSAFLFGISEVYVSPEGSDITGSGTHDDPFRTIQYGLSVVSEGGKVILIPGVYSTTEAEENLIIWPNKNDITLMHSDTSLWPADTDPVTIDATYLGGSGRLIYVGYPVNISIEGITLKNGDAQALILRRGGAIFLTGGTMLDLKSCIFDRNKAGEQAGAINAINSTVEAVNCTFISNEATGAGGGGWGGVIDGWDGSANSVTFIASGCAFYGNSAVSDAGVISDFISFTANDCIFVGNHANNYSSGGVAGWGNLFEAVNCTFESNTAENYGGVAYLSDTVSFTNSNFVNNYGQNGGGVLDQIGTLNMSDCTFTSNKSDNYGGVAYDIGTLISTNCGFVSNEAYYGGVFDSITTGTISGCAFSTNTAYYGGVIGNGNYVTSSWTVRDSLFLGNEGLSSGGVTSNVDMNISGGIFVENLASDYAGVFDDGTLTINGSMFIGNKSSYYGGVSYNTTVVVTNCTFISNEAVYEGGVDIYGTYTLDNCTLFGNISEQGGVFSGTNVTAHRSRFVDNFASVGGGVGYFNLSNYLDNCIFESNTAVKGGVFYVSYGDFVSTNCAYANNSANYGAVASGMSYWTSINDIFWGNIANITGEVFADTNPLLNYSDIQLGGLTVGIDSGSGGTVTTLECLTVNPNFLSTTFGDANYLKPDPYNLTVDSGTFEGAPLTDITGLVTRPLAPDLYLNFDMGVYEQAQPLPLTVYISPEGNDGTGDGSLLNPYRTLQKGLDEVSAGGSVMALPGVYNETGDYNVNWPGKNGITLKLSPEATGIVTFDAQSLGRVIVVNSAVDLTIESITIINGKAPAASAGEIGKSGGAIYHVSASGIISLIGCDFISNEASNGLSDIGEGQAGGSGGAIYTEGSVNALNSNFIGNKAGNASGGSGGNGGRGGGIYASGSASLIGCQYIGNRSGNGTANNGGYGGGIYIGGTATVLNCAFINNNTGSGGGGGSGHGGGAYVGGAASLFDSIFIKNTIPAGGASIGYGAGAYVGSTVTVTNCLFASNESFDGGGTGSHGGGMYALNGSILNSTFYNNKAGSAGGTTGQGGGVYFSSGSSTTTNSIFWGNRIGTGGNNSQIGTQEYNAAGTLTISNCDIQNGSAGVDGTGISYSSNNLSSDPQFMSTTYGDADFLKLNSGSPCIDTASIGAPALDLAGNTRPHGFGSDMGAYEFQGPSILVIQPNGGEIIMTGSIYDLTYEITPDANEIRIWVSTNDGLSWSLVTDEAWLHISGVSTYEWTPDISLASTECLVSVEVFDGANWNHDTSDAIFEIRAPLLSVVYISPNGSDLIGDGSYNDPYKTLQKGLDRVAVSGEVMALPGVYNVTGDYSVIWPNKNNITLKLSPEATEPATFDAQGLGRIINVSSPVQLTIESINMINGNAVTQGGAILLSVGSYMNIIDSRLTSNNAGYGGAIYAGGASSVNTTVEVTNCTFTSNSSGVAGGAVYGGNFYVNGSTFDQNGSGSGGGVTSWNNIFVAYDTLFRNNNSVWDGGVSRTANEFRAVNCVFDSNTSSAYGGITITGITAENCTFYNNTASVGGDISAGGLTDIRNSIIIGGTDKFNSTYGSIAYSNIEGAGWGGLTTTECISKDPKFISTTYGTTGYLKLSGGSPCIDTASIEAPSFDLAGNVRPHGLGNDMGAYEYQGPSIRVIDPNGGETVSTDSTRDITYIVSGETVSEVYIRLSTDEGNSWTQLAHETAVAYTGVTTYSAWTPDASQISTECLISIEAFGNGLWNFDTSNATFEIKVTDVYIYNVSITRESDAIGGGVILSWNTTPDSAPVDIYAKTGDFDTIAAGWSTKTTNAVNSNVDASQLRNGIHKWYKIIPAGETLTNASLTQDVVGKFDITVSPVTTAPEDFFISIPVAPCNGNNTVAEVIGLQADQFSQIHLFDMNYADVQAAVLMFDNKWRDADFNISNMRILPGYAYGFVTENVRTISIVGSVLNENATREIVGNFAPNFIGTMFPAQYDLSASGLNSSSYGGFGPDTCGTVYYFDGNLNQVKIAIHKDSSSWLDENYSASDLKLVPGKGYLFTEPIQSQFIWSQPRP